MERILATHEAQRRVVPEEYLRLSHEKQRYWLTLITACVTPGIPIDDDWLRVQLAAIWGEQSTTYKRLVL